MYQDIIDDNQVIFRSVHHPVGFIRGGKGFSNKKSWNLKRLNDAFISSVIWRRYAPSSAMAHAYGCDKSRNRNLNGQRDVYCGFYALKAGDLRRISGREGVLRFDVEHKIENGEIAHSHVMIFVEDNLDGDDLEEAKTYAVDRLWRSMSGPVLYICDGDRELSPHPAQSMRTEVGEKGPYVDDRCGKECVIDWIWYRTGMLRQNRPDQDIRDNGFWPAGR
jgi:hypothetical protein